MSNQQQSILVIEDHEPSRFLLYNYLRKSFQVWTSRNVVEAQLWLNEGNIPDHIILDWYLPEVSGSFFLDYLRNSGIYRDVPVLIVSSERPDFFEEVLANYAHVSFLSKPFDLDDIDECLKVKLVTMA
jgi:two-component system, chemotaxis family, chemotaxis protein CheY